MPKLRVAAPAGTAAAISAVARRKVRMHAPSTLMVNATLRAADVARSGLADRTLRPAGHLDVARAHDADVRCAAGIAANAARARDGHGQRLRLDRAGIDVAGAGNVVLGRLGLAICRLEAAGPRDRQL